MGWQVFKVGIKKQQRNPKETPRKPLGNLNIISFFILDHQQKKLEISQYSWFLEAQLARQAGGEHNNWWIRKNFIHQFSPEVFLRVQQNQAKIMGHTGAETIQGRKLYEEIRYVDFLVKNLAF